MNKQRMKDILRIFYGAGTSEERFEEMFNYYWKEISNNALIGDGEE